MVTTPPAHAGRNTVRRIVALFRPYRLQVAAVVGLIVVTSTIGILQTYETTKVGQLVMRDLRNRLYAHLETLVSASATFPPRQPAGQQRQSGTRLAFLLYSM